MLEKGTQLWRLRAKYAPREIEIDPQKLLETCIDYFEWCLKNPLIEKRVGFSKGEILEADVEHPRAMTIWGLSTFMGITDKTFYEWRRKRDDLRPVLLWAEQIMKEQKFTGAAAGMLNANIISRELGLLEKVVMESNVPQMVVKPPEGPVEEQPPIHGDNDK